MSIHAIIRAARLFASCRLESWAVRLDPDTMDARAYDPDEMIRLLRLANSTRRLLMAHVLAEQFPPPGPTKQGGT